MSCTFLYGKKQHLQDLKNEFLALVIPELGSYKDNVAEYYINNNGHYVIDTKVNNTPIIFLLDTGASSIVLTRKDAINAGINVNDLNYNIATSTANGINYVAYARIKKLQIFDIIFSDIPVLVTKSGLDQSLLGMSFLKLIRAYSINNNKLTIFF